MYGFSFSRRLAYSIAIIVDTGAIQQFAPNGPLHTGFDTTRLTLKAQVYKDDPHETLVAAGLLWGIGHSGSHAVNADGPSTLEPGFAFGQGLGDLPDSLKWLRPIAITGGASLEFPLQRSSTTYFSDPEDGSLELFSTKNDAILHWGFSIQYSTFYVSDRFTGTPRTEEPRQQYVPLIEFAVASPLGPSPRKRPPPPRTRASPMSGRLGNSRPRRSGRWIGGLGMG